MTFFFFSSDYVLIRDIIKYPRAVLYFCLMIINNLYCVPTYLIWMLLLLPLRKIHPDTYYWIEGKLYHGVLCNVATWSYISGFRGEFGWNLVMVIILCKCSLISFELCISVIESGDDISPCLDQRTLVLINHQSTGDAPFIMTMASAKHQIVPSMMWILDRVFMFTHFGVVSKIHQDFFIKSGPKQREQALVDLRAHIKKSYIPRNRKWLVLFPEGGFLRKRLEASQRYARKNNLPILKYVTLPRIGAMKTIIDEMSSCYEEKSISTPPSSLKCLNKFTPTNEFCVDNENNKRNSNLNKNIITGLNGKAMNSELIIGDIESMKDKIDEIEIPRSSLKYVLDITVAYDGGEPLGLLDVVAAIRKPCNTNMLYRLYRFSEVS